MPDWESYLNGELSIFCESKKEAVVLAQMSRGAGVPSAYTRDATGYRIMDKNQARVSGSKDPTWHVENGFTKRWVYFKDFIREPKVEFNQDEFLALLSGT